MASQEDFLKQINRSGYPFQLKVEQEILRTQSEHNWSVVSREHPWTLNERGSSGFIDLVLQHDHQSSFRLVIECKRIKADDARQLRWVFLVPNLETKETPVASSYEVDGLNWAVKTSEREWDDIRVWDDVKLYPSSLQSEFCILQNDDQRRQPILESLASEVLESIEGLAEEEVNITISKGPNNHIRLFIFPAIVTNAEIAVCRFDPANIKINNGTLDIGDVDMSVVPFIRFRKSLATDFPKGVQYNLRSANKARERTIFIANASSITEFLKGWKIESIDGLGFEIQKLRQN